MKYSHLLLIGNVLGYIIACFLYGQLLPILSTPAIIGVLCGGAVVFFPFLLSGLRYKKQREQRIQNLKEEERSRSEEEQQKLEKELEARYLSWTTKDLRAALKNLENHHNSDERISIIQEIRRRKKFKTRQ